MLLECLIYVPMLHNTVHTCVLPRETAGVQLEFWPMPSLRDKAHDGVLCTFSTRTSATAAGFAS
jgi:hypothetical protein